jgi:hypothetical protein
LYKIITTGVDFDTYSLIGNKSIIAARIGAYVVACNEVKVIPDTVQSNAFFVITAD